MPVLNPHPVFFPEAIASVLEQTLQDLEIVIVEDPSDRTVDIAHLQDGRIHHVVNAQRTSLVTQLNRGIALARAELVAQLDADDICEPHRLETQLNFLERAKDIDVVGSSVSVIDGSGRQTGLRSYPVLHDDIASAMRRFNPLGHSTVMYRKKVVADAGGYTERLPGKTRSIHPAEDYDLWCRLAQRGARFANIAEPLVHYRLHAEASKRQKLRPTLRASREIKRFYWQDSMTARDRLRMWGEGALLALPPGAVLRLFTAWQYRSRRSAA
jgi:glycosyltransferase involved in cell wall biosynthesis